MAKKARTRLAKFLARPLRRMRINALRQRMVMELRAGRITAAWHTMQKIRSLY